MVKALYSTEDKLVDAFRTGAGMWWGEHGPSLFEGDHDVLELLEPKQDCAIRRMRRGAVSAFGETASPAHVYVRAWLAGRLAEVPFGAFRVVSAVGESEPLKGSSKWRSRF